MVDASALTEYVHGADAGAARAEDVGIEDGQSRAAKVALRDLFDEARDVDVRRAGGRARSVEAVEAAVGFGQSGRMVEGRVQVWETSEQVWVWPVLVGCAHFILVS